jgi:hypothetical protein
MRSDDFGATLDAVSGTHPPPPPFFCAQTLWCSTIHKHCV